MAFLASPAAESVTAQVFVAYGGFVGLMQAPSLEARFDAPDGAWGVDELAGVLGEHFDGRDPARNFSAASLREI